MPSRYPSWGRYPDAPPARTLQPQWRHALPDFGAEGPVLAYGKGRSYGDVCLNEGGTIVDTAGLDRFIQFSPATGLLQAEAGVTLADVLALAVPHGWFLPVTPGTKHVTLGGAVANDVHGKNHHTAGTFGRHVTRMELVRSSGERRELVPGDPLFAATVGGLGLTGFITWVEFQLQPVESDQIQCINTPFHSLDEFFRLSERANARSPYVVAWLDALRAEGRGVIMEGTHAPRSATAGLPAPDAPAEAKLFVPIDAPGWALSKPFVRAFNAVYFTKQAGLGRFQSPYEPFFYPLDVVRDWNRGYGRRGLLQHQCVVPFAEGDGAIREVLRQIAASGAGSFLAVLKTFGDVPSPGLLSFPRPGVTLALDFANRGRPTVGLFHRLDALVREAGGRVYPAKDATMTGPSFRAFYPEWDAFAPHIDPAFSSSFWRRVMGNE